MSWEDLNSYICLALHSDDFVSFFGRYPSLPVERERLVLDLTNGLVDHIAAEADMRLALMPRPDAIPQAWEELGVHEESLFSPELLASCRELDQLENPSPSSDPSFDEYNRRETWEDLSNTSHRAAVVVLHALTLTEDPLACVAPLVYLAQHARVPLYRLAQIHVRVVGPPPASVVFEDARRPHGSALESYMLLTASQYLFLSILEVVDLGQLCLTDGSCRQIPNFPQGNAVCQVRTFEQETTDDNLNPHPPLTPINWSTSYAPINDWFPAQRDKLHVPFWHSSSYDERREADPELREAYKQRCLDVLVAWYMITKASSDRNEAIGLSSQQLNGCRTQLRSMILQAFASIGQPFAASYSLPISPSITPYGETVDLDANLTRLTHVELSPLNEDEDCASGFPCTENSERVEQASSSPFLQLPSEILLYIQLFLSQPSLLALSQCCVRLRQLTLPSLYHAPLREITQVSAQPNFLEFWEWRGPSQTDLLMRISKLIALLQSRADIRRCVRFFRMQTDRTNPGVPLSGLRINPWNYAIPISSPLAKSLVNLTDLQLELVYPFPYEVSNLGEAGTGTVVSESSPTTWVHDLLTYLARQYAQLTRLILVFEHTLSSNTPLLTPLPSETPDSMLPVTSTGDEEDDDIVALPWALREISITSAYRYNPHSPPDPKPLPIAPMLRLAGEALRMVTMSVYANDIGAVASFPRFPNIECLTLTTDQSAADVQTLLYRGFPSVTSLYLLPHTSMMAQDWVGLGSIPIDFALTSPMLETLFIRKYRVGHLPVSTRRVEIENWDCVRDREQAAPYNVVPFADVMALGFAIGYSPEGTTTLDNTLSAIEIISPLYPALRCLAVGYVHPDINISLKKSNLLDVISRIQAALPTLEVLILPVKYFSQRPRRKDYPADDGIDGVEERYACSAFQMWPGLKMLSFTGMHDADTPASGLPHIGRQCFHDTNFHVWARNERGSGARKVGRGDMPSYALL